MATNPDQKRLAEQEQAEVRAGWKMAGIGMQVASEVAAGTILGFLVDLWRGSGHVGVTIGAIAGIAVGLWSLIKESLKLNRQLDAVAPTKGRGRPLPPEPYEDEDDTDEPRN